MNYKFKGTLCGLLCSDCSESLSNVIVRLYRNRKDQDVTALAVADPSDTFVILTDDQVNAKASMLIAETMTDSDGNFEFSLGDEQKYAGGAFEIDVYCQSAPHRKPTKKQPAPRQFTITTLQPSWKLTEDGASIGIWQYCIPYRFWCHFRGLMDSWVICGHLTTCDGNTPIPGATVSAFDVDWLQDDALGSDVTDSTGRFHIYYVSADFKRTPIPWINFELVGGPDVYFKATLGSDTILNEPPSTGRTAGRQNIGPCFCVELCSNLVQGGGTAPEAQPHWMSVWGFDIFPAAPNPTSQFSIEGYAGGPGSSCVFSGEVELRGNCPLVNAAIPSNALQYRFVIGEWTWPGGTEDPTTMPSIAPSSLLPVTQIYNTTIGYVFYTDAFGFSSSADVIITSADIDPATGWIKPILGRQVTVDMHNSTTSVVTVNAGNFLRTDALIELNSNVITAAHPLRMPGGLPQAQAGRSLTTAEQEPIRRYTLQFEVRDASTLTTIYTDKLSSIILDNTNVIVALDLEELLSNLCNPLGGSSSIHILTTVDHPHLLNYSVSISNNTGQVHPPPAMPNGNFMLPGPLPNFFFRGFATGPHNASSTGGFDVSIAGDQPCAYRVTVAWQTRQYDTSGTSTEILYCK